VTREWPGLPRIRPGVGTMGEWVGGGREPRTGGRRERGSGTVLAVGLALALLFLLAGTVLLVQAQVAGSRAATAADLAALAGADVARGLAAGDPCQVALDVVARHGARLVSCTVEGLPGTMVEVRTAITVPGIPWQAAGRARAGPPPDSVPPGG